MLGFAYEVDSKLKEFWVNPNRTYQTIRTNRPKTIDWLKQVSNGTSFDKRTNLLYVAINLVNNKLYVGITKNPIQHRVMEHFNYAKRENGGLFQKAIRKYGEENFEFIIYAKFSTYEEAQYHEQRLIASVLPEYNMTQGGEGIVGLKLTEETRKKMSEARKGKPGNRKGKPLSPESNEKRRQTWLRRYNNGEFKTKPYCRSVVCITDGKEYSSIKEAAVFYQINRDYLQAYLRGCYTNPKIKGLEFKYTEK